MNVVQNQTSSNKLHTTLSVSDNISPCRETSSILNFSQLGLRFWSKHPPHENLYMGFEIGFFNNFLSKWQQYLGLGF